MKNPRAYCDIPAVMSAVAQIRANPDLFGYGRGDLADLDAHMERVLESWVDFAYRLSTVGAASIPAIMPPRYVEWCRLSCYHAMAVAGAALDGTTLEEFASSAEPGPGRAARAAEALPPPVRKFIKEITLGNIVKGWGAGITGAMVSAHPLMKMWAALTLAWLSDDLTVDLNGMVRTLDGISFDVAPVDGKLRRPKDNAHRDMRLTPGDVKKRPKLSVRTPFGVREVGQVQFMVNLGEEQPAADGAPLCFCPGTHMLRRGNTAPDSVYQILAPQYDAKGREGLLKPADWVAVRAKGVQALGDWIEANYGSYADWTPAYSPPVRQELLLPVTAPERRRGQASGTHERYLGMARGGAVAFFSDTIHKGTGLGEVEGGRTHERITKYVCYWTPRMLRYLKTKRYENTRVPWPVAYYLTSSDRNDVPCITTNHWGSHMNSGSFIREFRGPRDAKDTNAKLATLQGLMSVRQQLDAAYEIAGFTPEQATRFAQIMDSTHTGKWLKKEALQTEPPAKKGIARWM